MSAGGRIPPLSASGARRDHASPSRPARRGVVHFVHKADCALCPLAVHLVPGLGSLRRGPCLRGLTSPPGRL